MATKKRTRGRKRKSRALIVDDHPVVRRGLAQLIAQEPDLEVCGEAESVREALQAIRELEPDVVVVDVVLKSGSGIELVKDISVRYPDLPVLVLSMHDESLFAERALRAGARGYIMKQEATDKLLEAIRRVLRGEIYLSDGMASKMLHKFVRGRLDEGGSLLGSLTDRELEVFQMIGRGLTTRQIAHEIHLSVKTIETYREHIKGKLVLGNGIELLQHATWWVQTQGKL